MSASLKVFVCSTRSDLSDERDGVLHAIRCLGLQHDSMEFFGARDPRSIVTCLEEVRASDVLVVIVSHWYGSLIPGLDISYSQAEYEEGVNLEKPCLVYIRDENVAVLPKHMEGNSKKRKLLKKWKQTLQSRHTVASFQDCQDLAVRATADLARNVSERVVNLLREANPAAGPGAQQALGEAVGSIATGAAEGDTRLQQALSLLADNKIADASQLLKTFAEDKTARAEQAVTQAEKDRKDAAVAYRNLGAIAGLRDPKQALKAYQKAVALDPDDLDSLFWVGWIQKEYGDLNEAQARFERVLALATTEDKVFYKYWSLLGLGDIKVKRGDLAGALKSYRDGLAIADRLAKSDANNAGWQRDLSVSYDKVGDVQVAQGDLAGALKSHTDSLAIADGLAKSDLGNASWQRDLSVSYNKIGDVRGAQGDLASALTSYRDGLAIRDRLAKSDSGNAGWQRDLAVSYEKIGGVKVAQGDLSGALTSHRDSLAIRDRLAKSDQGNAGWQRDLSISYEKVGDVLLEQGDLAGALKSYSDSLAIKDRLAKSDPGNAVWQRGLSVSYGKLAAAYRKSQETAKAREALASGRTIIAKLVEQHPDWAEWRRNLAWFDAQIAELGE